MSKIKTPKTIKIFTDGGARGNPGPAGIGVVLKDEKDEIVTEISKFIGIATNNVAEYMAVVYGLQEAVFLKAKKVILNVDSQLVARQLKGSYKIKDESMKKFAGLALNLFRAFDEIEITEIPREENEEADALVNKAINLQALL